jgi:hypothetical protein
MRAAADWRLASVVNQTPKCVSSIKAYEGPGSDDLIRKLENSAGYRDSQITDCNNKIA